MGTAIVDVLDDEFVEIGLTRSEVLHARGYDDDRAERSSPVQLVPEALCVICGSAIPADRLKRRPTAKTCSNTCSYSLTRQRQQRYDATWRSKDKRKAKLVAVVDEAPSRPERDGTTTTLVPVSPPLDTARVVSVVAGLVSAGLSVGLDVDGAHIDVR
jgi:predicted nucleic acid-binding Zn ribbon protein